MHWNITDQPPNSDRIWRNGIVARPSFVHKPPPPNVTNSPLSSRFSCNLPASKASSFLAVSQSHGCRLDRSSRNAQPFRVVIPIIANFPTEDDTFRTKKFDRGIKRTIYDYTRRDVPDSFALPKPLFDFSSSKWEKYAGAPGCSSTTPQSP